MRCLVISVCQWHGDREKNQLFSPVAYPRMGHIRKCFLENPYPGDIPVKAKHKTDPLITEKNLFGLGIILFRNRSLVYRFPRNKLL